MSLAIWKAEFEKKLASGDLDIKEMRPRVVQFPDRRRAVASKSKDERPDLIALTNAARAWAQKSTNQDLERSGDVERDKLRVVRDFFAWLDKDLLEVTPVDVAAWLAWLGGERNLSARTVYGYCSHLSSFFDWLMKMEELARYLKFNPVKPVFPRLPEAYQSAGTRSLSDEALGALWRVMERTRKTGAIIALRDYAIFRFFVATGDRRRETLSLKGSDVEMLKTGLVYFARKKGGNRLGRQIRDAEVARALKDYIRASGRRLCDVFGRDVPLWLAHDRALKRKGRVPEKGLTSQAFAVRMKIYAEKAGIYNFHLHTLRHTFARIVSEETQSLSATQEALGHKNMKTTRIYVERIEIVSDSHSHRLKMRARARRAK